MPLNSYEYETLKSILIHEHKRVACSLGLIDDDGQEIDRKLLYKSIGIIDRLSRRDDDYAKNVVISISSVLWTYRKKNWDGLREFLILVLSRVGFSPSSIMVDDGYDHSQSCYSPLNGMVNQVSIAAHQLKHEVTVCEKLYLLTSFQYKVWRKIENHSIVGISAPTSAGKSFIISLKAIDLIKRLGGNIVYIVPTLSLVSQVSIDFRKLLNEFNIDNYSILNTYDGNKEEKNRIYVLTQEKAIGAFGLNDLPFNDVRILIVDEIQNVERVSSEDDQRAKTLYDLLVDFRHSKHPDHIVISGPRIVNIGNVGIEIFGKDTDEEEAKSSPVANFTYAIFKVGEEYYLRQYSPALKAPISLKIKYPDPIKGIGGVQYQSSFHDYLVHIISGLGEDSKNIIFSPIASQARKTAVHIASKKYPVCSKNIDSLIEYLSGTVHPKYDLCKTISRGVAYHHGKLPHHVRRVIEKAVSEKMINNVVCTTTLMQGVNLPAQNVIMRNPNLFVSKRYGDPSLTDYEIANLRGRAGRLLKDFIGRTIVLDGNSFEVPAKSQEELFRDKTKEIKPGYGLTYAKYKERIREDLFSYEVPSEINREYSFLLTYIRQTILRHGQKAINRFESVGIDLPLKDFVEIRRSLASLEVPVSVCIANRYWDPFDLDKLYSISKKFTLPHSPGEYNLAYKIKEVVSIFRDEFPLYFKRYFNMPRSEKYDLLLSACINAESWLKGKPLRTILNTSYHDTSDKIEKTISILQNKISFGLPMLLKPIYGIALPKSSFLRYIELGAFKPVARKLIEYSVPRETAIYLSNYIVKNKNVEDKSFYEDLTLELKKNSTKLNYWIKSQIETLV